MSQVANAITTTAVACPECGASVPVTEALAAPLIQATRAEFERKLKEKDAALSSQVQELETKEHAALERSQQLALRESALAQKESAIQAELERQRNEIAKEVSRLTELGISSQLEERLATEKIAIAALERQRAAARFADELAESERDRAEQTQRIAQLTEKLTTAQTVEIELKRRERDFEDRERELPLVVEREVGERLEQVRIRATNEASERLSLQLSEKERQIRDLAGKLEEASRKAQQGSQQSQGETLELVLEDQLRRQFPFDELQPVPKGEFGGDTLHVVRDSSGRECGRILWEFKRTKVWQPAWITKLKEINVLRGQILQLSSRRRCPLMCSTLTRLKVFGCRH